MQTFAPLNFHNIRICKNVLAPIKLQKGEEEEKNGRENRSLKN